MNFFYINTSGWTSRASPGASSSSSHDRRALPGKVAHATAFVTLGSRHDAGKMWITRGKELYTYVIERLSPLLHNFFSLSQLLFLLKTSTPLNLSSTTPCLLHAIVLISTIMIIRSIICKRNMKNTEFHPDLTVLMKFNMQLKTWNNISKIYRATKIKNRPITWKTVNIERWTKKKQKRKN